MDGLTLTCNEWVIGSLVKGGVSLSPDQTFLTFQINKVAQLLKGERPTLPQTLLPYIATLSGQRPSRPKGFSDA
jgi:hypothetical protein